MRQITEVQAQALDTFLTLDSTVWYDTASALSCVEVEALVGLLRAFGEDTFVTDQIIEAHAESDEGDDMHWRVEVTA